jgi:hypothetical protein
VNDTVYIFAHIPKTGGTTMRKHFETHLEPYTEFIHLAGPKAFYHRGGGAEGILPFEKRSLEERQKARVILGHRVNINTHKLVPGKRHKHIVFLRDPVSWTVSRYNWKMNVRRKEGKEILTFDQWYSSVRERQTQLRWLLKVYAGKRFAPFLPASRKLKMANALLETFDVVSLTERINMDCPLLFKHIGVPEDFESANVAGQRHPKILSPNEELRAKLAKPLALDIELYETWKAKMPVMHL